ncbi:hypothetical protein [Jannaschia ovalis]|uniref:Uncharacterized protein n=1 Tax=Jannaschia ovalis TaxID=3038773 RepID=A0ABY8LDD0_9RHOB|nr:hypothetical protein [Jannaschia sp. GRR-S6-38]WGH78193.1 hypothetical protein P8627_14320 [Jannaschia sp. GRR-S6-38]
MLQIRDLQEGAAPDVVTANDVSRRLLLAQGDDGLSARRVDFGFKQRRLFAARPDQLRDDLGELGLVPMPPRPVSGVEGDMILSVEASPWAADFDRLETIAATVASRLGWICTGWCAEVSERL